MKRLAIIAASGVMFAFSGAAMADGQSIYESGTSPTCASCHDRGTAGAPKINEPGDWDGIDLDAEALVDSTMDGKGAMPAYDGRADRDEVKEAVEYMLSTIE
ncbi:cytochrome c551 [Halorhodospira halochloris]|nr:cytochrome c [Halorhodospira halochloris]MBK1651271.1 hypothetical protein [Halorhodospira halochloris]MCG5548603.1 c-type cytochrome [Halorhodospira halochloris]BAU57549.1 cytochrome c551 [Halorhodospira halochloris]